MPPAASHARTLHLVATLLMELQSPAYFLLRPV
jgi:hypothetical protein